MYEMQKDFQKYASFFLSFNYLEVITTEMAENLDDIITNDKSNESINNLFYLITYLLTNAIDSKCQCPHCEHNESIILDIMNLINQGYLSDEQAEFDDLNGSLSKDEIVDSLGSDDE